VKRTNFVRTNQLLPRDDLNLEEVVHFSSFASNDKGIISVWVGLVK
jgi:hypothetical protein